MANNIDTKRIIEEILGKIGVAFEEISEVERPDGGKTAFVVKTAESGLLIGNRGENLSALNHVIKRIVGKNKKEEEGVLDFYVDVNDYHEKLLQDVKNKAQILAERARSFKVNVEMDPMTSYERMIIHTYFENTPDIETESKGVGRNRRVILKYVGE